MNKTITGDDNLYPKICSMIILPVSSMVFGILPMKLGEYYRKSHEDKTVSALDKVMSFCMYFGGGVLLSTIFLHLLPEIHQPSSSEKKGSNNVAEFVMCVGFFIMYFVDELVHKMLVTNHRHPLDEESDGGDSIKKADVSKVEILNPIDDYCNKNISFEENPHAHHENEQNCVSTEGKCMNIMFNESQNYNSCGVHDCHVIGHHHTHAKSQQVSHRHPRTHNHEHEHGMEGHLPDANESAVRGLLIVLAFSIHEIFEGMTIGLERKSVWSLLVAVSLHKLVIALFIGIQLMITRVRPSIAYIYICTYALTSSVGIAIGLNITEMTASSMFQSMATGTLLYVTFFEVYSKQFGSYKLPGVWKATASVIGFGFMTALQSVAD